MIAWNGLPTDDDGKPDRRAVWAMLTWTSVPAIWRQLTPRHWAALGRLMIDAIPDEDAARAEVNERHPGWADQADAAAAEAFRLTDRAVIPGTDRVTMEPDRIAEWGLRGQVLRIMAGLAGGSLKGCQHVDIATPTPMFAASWGTYVTCRRCFARAPREEPSAVEAVTCDLCGRRQHHRPVMLATPTVGLLTIGMGVCVDCVARMADAQ